MGTYYINIYICISSGMYRGILKMRNRRISLFSELGAVIDLVRRERGTGSPNV